MPNPNRFHPDAAAVGGNPVLAYFSDIKLAHSIFAIPFALVSLIYCVDSIPSVFQLVGLLVCMVSARSFAMGLNRLIDARIDAQNPRTKMRMIPAGRLDPKMAIIINLVFGVVFVASAFSLSKMAGLCSPVVLLLLGFYPFMKRISAGTHFYLGFCLGMAPVAVEVALKQSASLATILIGAGVVFWTAGFDMIYAKLDVDFDRQLKLHSVPARFGVAKSLWISRVCFLLTILCLLAAGSELSAGAYYHLGVGIVGILLFAIQYIVKDLGASLDAAKIDQGFFTVNLWVGVSFCVMVMIDRYFS